MCSVLFWHESGNMTEVAGSKYHYTPWYHIICLDYNWVLQTIQHALGIINCQCLYVLSHLKRPTWRFKTPNHEASAKLKSPWARNISLCSVMCNSPWPLTFRQCPWVMTNDPAVSMYQLIRSFWYNSSLRDTRFLSAAAERVDFLIVQLWFTGATSRCW